MRRLLGAAVVTASSVLLVTSCTNLVKGMPVSVYADPFRVAGLPATDGPSGVRPDAPDPTREVKNTDGGPEDELAAQAISDIEQFWQIAYDETLRGKFQPVDAVHSWDSASFDDEEFCGDSTMDLANAGFCPLDQSIGWDRGELVPDLRADFGDMAVPLLLAHEYGHSVQRQAKLSGKSTPTLVSEQRADCFAGVYLRWVAEGQSERFTLNTSNGLNTVLAAMISLRDPLLSENEQELIHVNEHGSAFERISAFQFGFTNGSSACVAIDAGEISQRRDGMPIALPQDQTGEWPVSEETVTAIIGALNITFSPSNPPTLTFDGTQASSCPDARPSPPASYCPSTNTIAVSVPELEVMGTASDDGDTTGLIFGDNTAYSALTSRFMLAIQQQKGRLILNNAQAALRTACLTGVASKKMFDGITVADGTEIKLTAGDLDEAVSGMLTSGLAAADVNGVSVPSGFSRIDAFRTGVMGDQNRCLKRYP